jgi:ribosome-binding protein aMBF1 (putative translation factor)
MALAPLLTTLLEYASLRGAYALHDSSLPSLSHALRRHVQRRVIPRSRHDLGSLLCWVADRMRDTAIDAEILKNLARNVRRLREAQGLSQAPLAALKLP